MRTRIARIVFVVLVVAACGSQSAAQPSSDRAGYRGCNRTNEPNYAYVVVQHMSGVEMETCVNFTPTFISGLNALNRAGIEFQTQRSGTATIACQIDREPLNVGDCGGQALGTWVTYVASSGDWRRAAVDLTVIRVYNAQAIGWRYVRAGTAPSPPPHL